jgi:hypothetical protein
MVSMHKIEIPNLTMWGCRWSYNPPEADKVYRVLRYCAHLIKCERVVMFSAVPGITYPGIETIPLTPYQDIADWNVFVNYEVPKHVSSDFIMSIHEDGFPICPELWDNEFLNYDYIGAPWPDGQVGNGGFNIESRRMFDAKMKLQKDFVRDHPSDNWLCKFHRQSLESDGLRFAPTPIALKFSTEYLGNEKPSFGFHGRICSPEKYAYGWSEIEAFERTLK